MKRIISVLLTLSFISIAQAQDGVQFDMAPAGINNSCKAVVFKGTQRYQNIAFLMPRLRLAKTKRGIDALEFLKLSGNRYLLQMGFFFPRFTMQSEIISYRDYDGRACSYKEIKRELNQTITDPRKKIHHIVPLQIQNIGVEIDGVDKEHFIAGKSTSILKYEGEIKKVEIPLPGREAFDDLLVRLKSDLGLNINVNFKFLARKVDGYCDFSIQTQNISNEIKTSLGAKFNVPLAKLKLPATDLQTELTAAIKKARLSMNGSSYCERSDDETFSQAAMGLLNKINSVLQKDLEDYRPILGGGDGGSIFDNWKDEPLPDESFNNSFLSSSPNQMQRSGLGEKSGKGVSVSLFLSTLNKKKNYSFKMMNMGKAEVRTYTTSLLITRDEDDTSRRKIPLYSGEKTTSTRLSLGEGEEIKIYPLREILEKTEYQKKTIFYDKDALKVSSGSIPFPKAKRIKISEITTEETNEGSIAYYSEKKVMPPSPLPAMSYRVKRTRYRWGEQSYFLKAHQPKPQEKPYQNANLESLKKSFNIGFVFNKKSPSRIYSLSQLLNGDLAEVKLDYDEYDNVFSLTASSDMGDVRVKNLKRTLTKPFPYKIYFQDSIERISVNGIFSTGWSKPLRKIVKIKPEKRLPLEVSRIELKVEKVGASSLFGNTDQQFNLPVNLYDESAQGKDENSLFEAK